MTELALATPDADAQPLGAPVSSLAVFRRQPDGPDRPAAGGAAEHARRTGPGRAGPLRVFRRHRRPREALAAADLQHRLRLRHRAPGAAGPRFPSPDQGGDARWQPLPRARPADVLLGARDVRRAGAVFRRYVRQAAQPRRKGADLPRSPRRGTAATASASGRCPPTTPPSSGTGTACSAGSSSPTPPRKYGVGYVTKGFPCPKGVPPALWRAVAPVFNPLAAFLTTGGLPPRARTLLGLPWTDRQERRYQRFAALCRSRPINFVWDRLPMRLRYNKFAQAGYARG